MNQPELVRKARELHVDSSDSIQIDEDAATSEADDGVWVAAWVWVPL